VKRAEDYKRETENKMFNHLSNIVDEEIRYSKINKMKLLSDWRVIMRIAKVDELRKAIELYMQYFERELDNKDAILQMLDKDIEEADEQYSIALTNHFIHIKQLTSLQDSRIKGLFKEFDKDVKELENEFNTETDHIKSNFESEQFEINNMIRFIREEYNEKILKVQSDFKNYQEELIVKIKDKYSKIQEKIKRAAINEATNFLKDISEVKSKSKDKSTQDESNFVQLAKKEKEIATEMKKVDKNTEKLKELKLKIKQNSEDWEAKINSLKSEKMKLIMSYKELKQKLIEFRNHQREKLKKLVKNSWDCITKLKEYIKLAEKILRLAEICRRLETERVNITNSRKKFSPIMKIQT
jgi:chromosome segregation ATPase